MEKTILVTGGAGFIGSHLIDRLLVNDNQIICLDNLNDYYNPEIKKLNQSEHLNHLNYTFIKGDIRDGETIRNLFENHPIDIVVHLAAMAGVRPSIEDPVLYTDVNINGTQILLEAMMGSSVKKFVFASSSSVYGNNKKTPFSEDDIVDFQISPYGATKKMGEVMCYTYHHLSGIPTSCLRFFTVYGPRQRPEMAIHKFVRMIHEGTPIPFFGDGETRRDYTYVDDIVAGVVASIDHCEGYEIYNLGESATTSLSELVAMIGEVCGREPVLERLPLQPGDVKITYADVSKARERLGYRPTTPVREGLERFLDWYRAQG